MTNYVVTNANNGSDVLVVPVFEDKQIKLSSHFDIKLLDKLNALWKLEEKTGKKGEKVSSHIDGESIQRVRMFGLGNVKDLSIESLKKAIGAEFKSLQAEKKSSISLVVSPSLIKKFGDLELGRAIVLAVEQAQYAFDKFLGDDKKSKPFTDVQLVLDADKKVVDAFQNGVIEGKKISEGVLFTRELGNVPPSDMTPAVLAEEAKTLESIDNVKVTVWDRKKIESHKMGCFLGVAKGSEQDPRFVIVEYKGGKEESKPTVLVGKGITFDSGGLSLKPSDHMSDMKFDMLGAATVLGTLKAAALLGLKKNIIGIIPTCENMPSGSSYRPDDILTAMNGKTVLVENTDAEGRLILADALCYVQSLDPKEVIDFATLTGACCVALGNERSGLFSTDDKLAERMESASREAGERLWRLPVGEEFSEAMKCEVADIKNIGGVGSPRYGGASTAASFLEFFTRDAKTGEPAYNWAHVDLSSSYYGSKGMGHIHGGANGFGVQTMVEFLRK